MTAYRTKLWTSVGAVIVLGTAACTDRHPDAGSQVAGAAVGSDVSAAAPAPSGAAAGESGGEAGVGDAYAAVPAASQLALRLAHLKGFFLIAEKVAEAGDTDAAAVLAGQGMLEVFDPNAAAYRQAGVDEKLLRAAAEKGDLASLRAAVATLDAAAKRAGGDPAEVVKGMVEIASGLYGGTFIDGGVDTTEYQHSYGAALSAKDVADSNAGNPKIVAAKADLDGLLAFWKTTTAPDDGKGLAPAGKVKAQASRIELAVG